MVYVKGLFVLMVSAVMIMCGSVFAVGSDDVFEGGTPLNDNVLRESTDVNPDIDDSILKLHDSIRSHSDDDSLYPRAAQLYSSKGEHGFKVYSKGALIDFSKYDNVTPTIVNGRTLVPVRALSESLGAGVSWNPDTREITIVREGKTIVLKLESNVATVNGTPVTLDVPASAPGGRTLVPLRFVGESFGQQVGWYTSGDVKVISLHD